MQSGIYKITNQENGKSYIGSAVNLVRRKREHLSGLRRGVHWNDKLQHTYRKYGESTFIWSDLLICAKEQLTMYEQICMDHYQGHIKGYNLRPKAESSLGVRHSEKSKENFRKGAAGRIMPPMSEEAKRNKSISAKNRKQKPPPLTFEQKKILSKRAKAQFTGKKFSEEHRQKLAAAKLGRKLSQEHKDKIKIAQLAFRAQQREKAWH